MAEILKRLASAMAAEFVDTSTDGANQVSFLGVDRETGQTTIVVVCFGCAADEMLTYLDAQKEKGRARRINI